MQQDEIIETISVSVDAATCDSNWNGLMIRAQSAEPVIWLGTKNCTAGRVRVRLALIAPRNIETMTKLRTASVARPSTSRVLFKIRLPDSQIVIQPSRVSPSDVMKTRINLIIFLFWLKPYDNYKLIL